MNATERGRRSDSLHYGETSRRDLCDMVARLEDRQGRLEKLAQDMLHVISMFEQAHDEAIVKDSVMMDVEHFEKRMNELGIKERNHG